LDGIEPGYRLPSPEVTAIDLDLARREHGTWRVLEVHGEVDAYSAPQLREALREMDGQGARILVDLNGVDFMDSSGLGVLIGALKRARERDGELALVCTGQTLLRLLAITGLDRVFTILDAAEAAS
jgi:anti-sigma B factor antagonist